MHSCNLYSESHYQLANRFAWAWQLPSMGIPVALMCLGFPSPAEMNDLGRPFHDSANRFNVVLGHSRNFVPERSWDQEIKVGAASFELLIRVWEQGFPA
jgi:hypothetical protein